MGIYKAGKPFTLLQEGAIDSYTKLLIHSNTSDGSTTFADSSATGHTVTVSGHTHHETDQYKFGSTSIQFDGTGDVLSVADHADWTYGTGDLTIDMWIRPTTIGSGGNKNFIGASSNQHIAFACNSTGGMVFYSGNGSWVSTAAATSNVIVNNVWQHIAVSRASGVVYLFHNGILITSRAQVDSIDPPNVEVGGYGGGASDLFTGYMDEIRISKGIARWTETFSPPSSPYPTFSTYNIDSVGDDISNKDIQFPSNPSEDPDDIAFGVSSNVGAPLLDVYAGGNVGIGVSGTPTNKFEVQTGEQVSGSKFSVSSGNDSYTVMLLQSSDSTNGNTTIIDSSASSRTMTAGGIVVHSTDRPKFGKSSLFSGVNGDAPDKITYTQSTEVSPTGTNDMTFDCWVNLYGATNAGGKLWFGTQSDWYQPYFGVHTDRTLFWANQTHGGANLYYHRGSIALRGNTWEHVAVTINNKTVTLWVNGIKDGTHTYTTGTWTPAGTTAQIIGNIATWLDQVRISNKIRWTENFTPPERPYGHELTVDGPRGNLSTVTDSMETHGSGSVFSVNTTGGLPALNVLDNGIITKPYQPAFQVRGMASDQNLTTSPATVTFNSETFDVGNNMTSTTFTAPITGKYMFCAGGLFDGHTSNDYVVLQIFTSNFTYMTSVQSQGTIQHRTISILADMDKGDTADLRAVNHTSARGQLKNDAYWTYFSGHLVC